jgi:hypothetical protein
MLIHLHIVATRVDYSTRVALLGQVTGLGQWPGRAGGVKPSPYGLSWAQP